MTHKAIPYDTVKKVIEVLGYISKGNVPTTACDDMGLSYSTFCTFTAKYNQLRAMREEAEDRCYDTLADKLLTIHEDVSDPKMASVVSSNTKWLLERRRQRAYGARSTVEHMITADREVLDALNHAKARAQGGKFIEAKPDVDNVLDLTLVNGVAGVLTHVVSTSGSVVDEDEQIFLKELSEIS